MKDKLTLDLINQVIVVSFHFVLPALNLVNHLVKDSINFYML